MKFKKLKEKYTDEELAESFVFKVKRSPEQKQKDAADIKTIREKLKAERTESDILYSRVLQLRYLMEDYSKSPDYNQELSFAYFLRSYIRLNYKVNKKFASDIQMPETELSSILNRSRIPSNRTMMRLEIHSNNTIPAVSWYRVLKKEQEHELESNETLRKTEEKYVSNRLVFK